VTNHVRHGVVHDISVVLETLIFTLADCFVLLSAAAIAVEHSVDAFYPYFHERYRAHPTGRLELIEDSK
jgi:hypothetical protein